ncbi:MAG: hypothetical protein NTY48_05215 [Candidatus Diapherotrites archaeon]|nr:hypothetical protein [Candidatus Diapherotrites archaeon]
MKNKTKGPLALIESLPSAYKKGFPSAFRESDIRGIVGKQITPEFAKKIGNAIAKTFKSEYYILGRDKRPSSRTLERALRKGILESGASVYELEDTISPLAYFAARFYNSPGVFVTASHNPIEYNGFKIIGKDGLTKGMKNGLDKVKKEFDENCFQELRSLQNITLKSKQKSTKGKVIKPGILCEYKKSVLQFDRGIMPAKIVINNGGNRSGKLLKSILKEKKVEIIEINPKKWHISNPLIDKGEEVSEKIILTKADLGVAFDFDGDRTFFFDEKGNKLDNSTIAALIASFLLKEKGKGIVLYDVRSDWIIKDTVKANGGKSIMVEVGHTNVKEKMKKHEAIYCGEISGHNYFKESGYTESSIMPIIILLSIISIEKKPLSQIAKPFMKNHLLNETNYTVNNINKTIEDVSRLIKGGKRSNLDGLRVDFSDWWFNIRGSKNEPLIRLTMGAKKKKLLMKKKRLIESEIRKHLSAQQ